MELLERILVERITDPGQLGPAERERVAADPALQAALRENLALAQLKPAGQWVPDRSAVLARALSAQHSGGESMSLISRLFSGRRWYFQLAAAAVLMIAVTLLALVPRSSTWAQTNGYVLKFDYGMLGSADAESEHAALQDRLAELEAAVHEWVKARKAAAATESAEACAVQISVNVDNGHATAMIALADEGQDTLADLAAALAEVPGIPTPTITEATWFHANGAFDPNAGLSFNLMDHLFTFPRTASEEEIEQTINDWLAQNKPEFNGSVDVTISRNTEGTDGAQKEKLEVRIEVKDAQPE